MYIYIYIYTCIYTYKYICTRLSHSLPLCLSLYMKIEREKERGTIMHISRMNTYLQYIYIHIYRHGHYLESGKYDRHTIVRIYSCPTEASVQLQVARGEEGKPQKIIESQKRLYTDKTYYTNPPQKNNQMPKILNRSSNNY